MATLTQLLQSGVIRATLRFTALFKKNPSGDFVACHRYCLCDADPAAFMRHQGRIDQQNGPVNDKAWH